MRYFITDDGGWLTVSGDAELIASIPDGYREVTEEEYQEVAGVITLELPEPLAQEDKAAVALAAASPAPAAKKTKRSR